jgi:hypothetical protein
MLRKMGATYPTWAKQQPTRKLSCRPLRALGVISSCLLSLLVVSPAGAMSLTDSTAVQAQVAAPKYVTAKRVFTNADDISWTDASVNETHFIVEYRGASVTTWKQITKVASTSSRAVGKRYRVSFNGLPEKKYLCYRVAAINAASKSYSSQRCAGYRPSTPKSVEISELNPYWVTLKFERSDWELKYRMYYQADHGEWHARIYDAPKNSSKIAYIQLKDQTGTIMRPHTDYCFYVMAFNDLGTSEPSHTVCGNSGGPIVL